MHRAPSSLLWWVLLFAALAAGGRLPALGLRPFHTDEAVHGIKMGELLEEGSYRYDPTEYHGPTLYYAAWPFARLKGARDAAGLDEVLLRRVAAGAGIALVGLTFLLLAGVGQRPAAAWAALFAAVSPAMVYYSRYFIQEIPFVFFIALLMAAGLRYARRPGPGAAALAGAALGLMIATKETFVIAGLALLPGLWAAGVRPRQLASKTLWRDLGIAAAVTLGVAALLLTSFFTHPGAFLHLFTTFLHYAERAGGQGHEKPWFYYLVLLGWHRGGGRLWTELFLLVLGVLGALAAFFPRGKAPAFARFLAGYAAASWLIYALIPYKTPWLILGPLHATILLAGCAAARLVEAAGRLSPAWRGVACAGLLAGAGHLGVQAYTGSFTFAADERNPYVYGHTSPDLVRWVRQVRRVAADHPEGRNLRVHVIGAEYWPVPWYLRDFKQVGYWSTLPADARAPVMLVSENLAEDALARLGGTHQSDLVGLRPGVLMVSLFERALWERSILRSEPAAPAP